MEQDLNREISLGFRLANLNVVRGAAKLSTTNDKSVVLWGLLDGILLFRLRADAVLYGVLGPFSRLKAMIAKVIFGF